MSNIIEGFVAGEKYKGLIEKRLSNGKIHVNVQETTNTEWQRDLARGYPVLISVRPN